MHGNIECNIAIASVWFRETIEPFIHCSNVIDFFAEYDMYLFCGSGRNRNEKNQSGRKTNLLMKNYINIFTIFNHNVNY